MSDAAPDSRPRPTLLTVPEAAKAMRCGKTTVYSLFKLGELKSVKVANRRFVTAAEVERFIAEHERVSA